LVSALLKRLKKLEKANKPLMMDIFFEGNRYNPLSLHERQFQQIWDDIENGNENDIYELLKYMKDEEGVIDDGGLIYLMEALDPKLNTNLWDE
jgi:hypothetical protein